MQPRVEHTWDVEITDSQGGFETVPYTVFWDHNKDFVTPQSIADSCAAEQTIARKQKMLGVAAHLPTTND